MLYANLRKEMRPWLFLLSLYVLMQLIPDQYLDFLGLFNLKKIVFMIGALVFVQTLGSFFSRTIKTSTGFLVSGFLGGLVSSTAVTANLAKTSQSMKAPRLQLESLVFLGSTLAMLVEALMLTVLGMGGVHLEIIPILLLPIIATIVLTVLHSLKIRHLNTDYDNGPTLQILFIIKLACFIILILAMSKVLQKYLGQSGLEVATFLISLFEIHGSIIANTQLFEFNHITTAQFAKLLSVSVLASYLSKLFLIYSFGALHLKKQITIWTLIILSAVALGWFIGQIYTATFFS